MIITDEMVNRAAVAYEEACQWQAFDEIQHINAMRVALEVALNTVDTVIFVSPITSLEVYSQANARVSDRSINNLSVPMSVAEGKIS